MGEQRLQYALRIAEAASPESTLDCITAFCRTGFRGQLTAHLCAAGPPRCVVHPPVVSDVWSGRMPL